MPLTGQAARALTELRARIFTGRLRAGDRLAEIPLAEALGMSRTPIRLALSALQSEGLAVPAPGGGFAVRAFTVREVDDAVALRGQLEGMAARLVAEHGVSRGLSRRLHEALDQGDAALARGVLDEEALDAYGAMNTALHAAIAEAAGNAPLSRAIAAVEALPFASASALVPSPGSAPQRHRLLTFAHQQHHLLVEALEAGQGTRAEALAREHADNARRNLRLILDSGEAEGLAALIALNDVPA
ncbi:GntR family transcriptional regulator [Falsiroseomonas ponticola]|jgi:GntR family transcriptional regulator of vanillate catabolism|uniref:GntR family transcriptional regulator n=1 Tax=Falsiroseomonas ponticola TaxID=2786951 RepID=UPI00193407E7|nr:GntR family transcriptional regulator [Roseomonas ponticola]